MTKRTSHETSGQRVLKHAVRLQVHTRTVLKTILILCGATGLAAVAAVLTTQQVATYLNVSLVKPPVSSVQQVGTKDVPMIGLRLRASARPVLVQNLTFSVLTDSDGQFENGIANNVDPAQALESCVLQNAAGIRLSGPVRPSSESKTLSFAMSVPVAAQSDVTVRAVCTLGSWSAPGPGSDQIALVLKGPQDVRVSSGTTPLPISAVSLGFAKSINARGSSVSIWRGRPSDGKTTSATNTPVATEPAAKPSATAAPAAPSPVPTETKPALPTKSHPVFALASESPSGKVQAGMGEVLRFRVTAVGGPVDLFRLTFRVNGSARANASWLSCANIASTAKWGLRDASDPDVRLENPGDWLFYQADGKPCSKGGTLAYAVVDFTRAGDPQPKVVGADTPKTYILRVDSSDAAIGDTLNINVPAEDGGVSLAQPLTFFGWTDSWITKPLSTGIQGLPVAGRTLTY